MRKNNLIDSFNWIGQAKPQKEIIGHFYLIESIDLSRFSEKTAFWGTRNRKNFPSPSAPGRCKNDPLAGVHFGSLFGIRRAPGMHGNTRKTKGFGHFAPPQKALFRSTFWTISGSFFGLFPLRFGVPAWLNCREWAQGPEKNNSPFLFNWMNWWGWAQGPEKNNHPLLFNWMNWFRPDPAGSKRK